MSVKGEAIYKTSERIKKYGIEAYIKQLNKTVKAHRTGKEWIKYYQKKYPDAPLTIAPTRPDISRAQRSYWKDVKTLSEARDITPREGRSILKKLKNAKNVQVRVIKEGSGWQFILFARYEHRNKEEIETETRQDYKHEEKEQIGYSYTHYDEDFKDCEEEAFEEAKRDAQFVCGGSGWTLIKVLKETWIRFIGKKE